MTEWILTSVLVLLLLFQLLLWHKKRKKLAGFCFNAFTGLLTLFPVSFLLTQAGLSLPVNFLTGAASAILGAPALPCFPALFSPHPAFVRRHSAIFRV